MQDINIDDFYHDIASTLLALYQQFPRKISLYIEDICGPDDMDEFGLHSNRYLSCIGAVTWLLDENYIRYNHISHLETAEECTLTQKALIKLIKPTFNASAQDQVKSVQKQRSTLAQQLHLAIKEQNGMELRELIEQNLIN
ncbi:MAG: hypothetical protein V7785_03235 [Bermanella sp.]